MGRFLSILSGLFGIVTTLLSMLKEKKLIEQGKQEAAIDAIKEVEVRNEKADRAVAVDDAERTDRLRKRFDRAAGGE